MVVECVAVEEQYKKIKELKKGDVNLLKEWLTHQPHIPPMTEMEIILFLHSCYYSNEAAKKAIDNFYTARTHAPEFFKDKNPFSKDIINTVDAVYITPLPKLSPEGYVIVYFRLRDFDPNNYHLNLHMKLFDMKLTLMQQELGCVNGFVMLFDDFGSTMAHVMRASLTTIKKILYYVQEALPLRLKQVYIVNPPTFMDTIMNLIKPFMKKEIQELLHILPGDSILKRLPADCLPDEIGGTLGPIEKLNENSLQVLQDNADLFAKDEKRVADESKRAGRPKNAGEIFGVEGTFKKLDID